MTEQQTHRMTERTITLLRPPWRVIRYEVHKDTVVYDSRNNDGIITWLTEYQPAFFVDPMTEHTFIINKEQEVKVIWQKAPHGGPIPQLGVTPGGRN